MQVIQSFVITVKIHEWILALYPWFIKLSHNKDKRSAYTKPPRVHSKRLLLFILVCLLGRREALRRLPAVWPNVELKSRQFFYKSWPKIWPQQFCFKMPFFAKIQIVIQVFALLLLEDLRPWFFKIAQSGHTGSQCIQKIVSVIGKSFLPLCFNFQLKALKNMFVDLINKKLREKFLFFFFFNFLFFRKTPFGSMRPWLTKRKGYVVSKEIRSICATRTPPKRITWTGVWRSICVQILASPWSKCFLVGQLCAVSQKNTR